MVVLHTSVSDDRFGGVSGGGFCAQMVVDVDLELWWWR